MGLSQYTPIAMSMLNFNIDGDLDMGAYKIKVNHIAESTAAHGVVIDSVLKVDHIGEATAAHSVTFDNLLKATLGINVDHIGEYTGSHTVMMDNTLDLNTGIDFGNEARKKILAYGGGF